MKLDADCSRNSVSCKNEKCVSKSKICNGEDDCGDSSDEGEACAGENIGRTVL